MQIAEGTPALLIKISSNKELFANKQKIRWKEIVDTLGEACGLDELDRVIIAYQMGDNGQLTPEEGKIKTILAKEETEILGNKKQPIATTTRFEVIKGNQSYQKSKGEL